MEVITSSVTLSLHFHHSPRNPTTIATATAAADSNHGCRRLSITKAFRKASKRTQKPIKVKPFRERDAFPSSLPLHSQNPHTIYKHIQRFAHLDKLDEALTILDYVDHQGIPVNPTTFSSLLAACVRCKSLAHGKQTHVHIRINGLEKNEFLRTKLVHMYTSCGSIEDARRVFDESTSSSVFSWNALLRGMVISGRKRYRDVLSTFTEMRELGVELNVHSFSNVIKSFAGASALKQGLKTHALLIKKGFVDSSLLSTSLIDMYFKCGKVKLARQVFDEIVERDVVVWGAMIAGLAHNRRQREALDFVRLMIIEEGIYPNLVILTTILPLMGEIGAQKLGKEVHAYVLKSRGYLEHPFIQSGLVDLYCKCGDMVLGRRVFYGSRCRNAISWTALMSGYVSNGRLDQALRSIVWMQQEGFRPDVVTVATILPVCAELRALKQGKEVHAYALKSLFLPNVSIVTSLMVMYSRCGVLDYSVKLFGGLEARNVKAWTAMVDSYMENGYSSKAIEVFRSMQLSKHRPDSVAMARVLTACCELKALRLAKEIHGYILKKEFESIPFVSAGVVKMYGSCGDIKSAKLAFDAVPVKGSMTWTAIIEAYGYNRLFQNAITCFDQLMSGGFTPNAFTLTAVLSICDQAGFVDEALRIFSLMIHRYNSQLLEEHYSAVTGLLTRFGRIEEAQRFLRMSTSTS